MRGRCDGRDEGGVFRRDRTNHAPSFFALTGAIGACPDEQRAVVWAVLERAPDLDQKLHGLGADFAVCTIGRRVRNGQECLRKGRRDGWIERRQSIQERYMEERRGIVLDDHLFAIQRGLRCRWGRRGGRPGSQVGRRSQGQHPTPRPNPTTDRQHWGSAA